MLLDFDNCCLETSRHSFFSVHLSTICWASKLRVIYIIIAQSIESVVATWPHKLHVSLADIHTMFSPILEKFKIMAKDDPYIRYFVTQYMVKIALPDSVKPFYIPIRIGPDLSNKKVSFIK